MRDPVPPSWLDDVPPVADPGAFLSAPRDRFGEVPAPAPEPPRVTATPFVPRPAHEIAPREWIHGKYLIRRYVAALIAPGGVGKSTYAATEAVAMAAGRRLLHDAPHAPLTVWIWNGEDPADETERRLLAAMAHHGVESSEIAGRIFSDSGRDTPIKIATTEGGAVRVATPVVDALVAEIRARGIDALIVDPFVSAHAVAENDNGAMDAAAKAFALVGHRTGCSILLIHHSRKLNGAEADADSARGGSALIAAVRSARVLNVMSAEAATGFGIAEADRRSFVRVDDAKANLAAPSAAKWFRLASVGLGNASGDRPEDFVAVAAPWSPPAVGDGLPPDAVQRVRAAVAGKGYRASAQAADWCGYAIGDALGMNPHDDAVRSNLKRLIKVWLGNGVLAEVEVLDRQRRPRRAIDAGGGDE